MFGFKKFFSPFAKGARGAESELPRPHGFREEFALAKIADEEVREILRSPSDTVSWAPDHVDVSGIVIWATDEEVRGMVRDRVLARAQAHGEAAAAGRGLRFTRHGLDRDAAEARLQDARLARVEAMGMEIERAAEQIVCVLREALSDEEAVTLDPETIRVQASLAWPLEGWDGRSTARARERILERVVEVMRASGHGSRVSRGATIFSSAPESGSGSR